MENTHVTDSTRLLQEITAANQHLMDCFASGDAAAMARCYAEDAHLLVPHAEVIEGRAAIEWVFKKTMSPGQVYVFKTVELDGDAQSALEVGRYTRSDGEGNQLDKGKYIVRWKRIGPDWKIHRDMLSTSLPKEA